LIWLTAGAAFVEKNRGACKGFTLLEAMVVILIIGIITTLGYTSLMDLISTNRAKETAQTMRTFVERALIDAKRQNKSVRICINGNAIIAEEPATTSTPNECGKGKEIAREALGQGFSISNDAPVPGKEEFKNDVESRIRIGLSGIDKQGYFAACGFKNYCGGAVKLESENSFKAYIKKGASDWEAL
jgi:prepilin-type N-terminal cleavage/methylation domain-containing protein